MSTQKPSATIRHGIIGIGIGQSHINGLKNVVEGEIAALCDVDVERAQEVARKNDLDGVPIYATHQEMLEQADIHSVSVCLPNFLHTPVTLDCLNAGKHVLCEKPLAMNASQAQQIVEAAEQNNKKCMVGQVVRFRPDSQFLKKAIQDGQLGEIYYAHTGWLRKRGIPGYGGWFTTKEKSGGGPLIDIGVHMLDIAWWLCGCPEPVTVSGSTYAKFGPRGKGRGNWGVRADRKEQPSGTFDVEDLALGMIRFANGLTINLEVSWAIHNRQDHQWCQLFGDEGGCDWGTETGIYRDIGDVPVNSTPALPRNDMWKDMWKGQMQHFVDSILNDTAPDPDARQGLTMMKMLEGIYQSAEAGAEIKIK